METSRRSDPEMVRFQRVAGAFVHDFNNLFQTALGNLDLLSGRIDDPAATRLVNETVRSVERAVELTERLNLIGNKYPQRFQRIAVDPAIGAAAQNLRGEPGDQPEIAFRSRAAGLECHLPPGQLERALAALVTGGPRAFARGALAIETAACDASEDSESLAPGVYVRITVSADNGAAKPLPAGIPASLLPAPGESTGFMIARLFALQLGGTCRIDGNTGGKTQVDLILPACGPEVENRSGGEIR